MKMKIENQLKSKKNKSSLIIVSPDSWHDLQNPPLPFSDEEFKKDSKKYTRLLLDSVAKYYECSFDSFFDLSQSQRRDRDRRPPSPAGSRARRLH